jgi:magnesium transporter
LAADLEQLLTSITGALATERAEDVARAVAESHPADVAEVYRVLPDEERSNLIFLLPARMTAEVIAYLDDADLEDALDELDGEAITEIVTELPPDEAADVLGELSDDQQRAILELIPDEQADQLEELLTHDEESAGGIMTPDLVRLHEDATVAEAIEAVRRISDDEEIHYVYTVDEAGRLTGLVPLRRLVTSATSTRLGDITTSEPLTVAVTDDQEFVANQIRKYDVSAVPVVDDAGVLVGRITHDDILDVAEEEADEDIYYMAGTEAAELEEDSPARAAFIRLRWLLACMLGTALSGLIVALFNDSFNESVFGALILFVPMMGAMGGNSGIQISTIIVRSLATGDMESRKVGRDFARELPITIIMAPMCGIAAAMIAGLGIPALQRFGRVGLDVPGLQMAISVGVGMTCAIFCASLLGMLLPHMFRKVGVDPAIASGPIVTTTNDIVSVSLYFFVGLAVVA